MKSAALGLLGLSMLALTGTALVVAGPLAPPSGAVAPTYKTLAEIEPRIPLGATTTPGDAFSVFKVTQPGSYYLTGNLAVPNNMAAIEILADGVTIDLNGFMIERTGTGASTRSLIRLGSTFINASTVKNGCVRNSGLHGVELGSDATVSNVKVESSVQAGITAFQNANITDCVVTLPGTRGISVQSTSFVARVSVASPGAEGIVAMSSSRVENCFVSSAGGVGIEAANQSTVSGCTVVNGDSWGISASLNTTQLVATDNNLSQNAAGNIRLYFRGVAKNNTCTLTALAAPNILLMETGNRAEGNTCVGGSDGVKVDAGGTNNLVICNSSVGASSGHGFASIPLAGNQVGPVVSAAGMITSTSPWANFSR